MKRGKALKRMHIIYDTALTRYLDKTDFDFEDWLNGDELKEYIELEDLYGNLSKYAGGKLTREDVANIVILKNEKKSTQEIADRFGVTWQAIHYWVQKISVAGTGIVGDNRPTEQNDDKLNND